MATRAEVSRDQSRWVRPLIPILVVLVIGTVFFFVGNVIAAARSPDAAPFDFVTAIPYILVAGAIAYGLGVAFGDERLWQVGTREVVYMATGAALYGVLSWATNALQLPSISFVSFRPAVVIPIFFGIAFGPAVGFFSGFVGNVLGDALTGWGVFPVWCLGNGLMGMVPGLVWAFRDRLRALDVVAGVVAVICLLFALLIVANPIIPDTWDATQTRDVSGMWWLPILGATLVVGLRFGFKGAIGLTMAGISSLLLLYSIYLSSTQLPASIADGLIQNVLVGIVLPLLVIVFIGITAFRLAWDPEVASLQVWGALGIIIGIGFAALANMWTDGYGFAQTMLGQFVPAAGSNLIVSAVLLPVLMNAWNSAQERSGRGVRSTR